MPAEVEEGPALLAELEVQGEAEMVEAMVLLV
jgi:hypothetical protein